MDGIFLSLVALGLSPGIKIIYAERWARGLISACMSRFGRVTHAHSGLIKIRVLITLHYFQSQSFCFIVSTPIGACKSGTPQHDGFRARTCR